MNPLPKYVKYITLTLLALFIVILVFDIRVLFSQKIVNPGEDYVFGEWGNLGDGNQASLACKYFNGRGVIYKSYWYSPDNLFGRDSCPNFLSN